MCDECTIIVQVIIRNIHWHVDLKIETRKTAKKEEKSVWARVLWVDR